MARLNKLVSDSARRYMRTNHLSQEVFGRKLGLSQVTISRKLRGARQWSLSDLEELAAIGVDVPDVKRVLGVPSVEDSVPLPGLCGWLEIETGKSVADEC